VIHNVFIFIIINKCFGAEEKWVQLRFVWRIVFPMLKICSILDICSLNVKFPSLTETRNRQQLTQTLKGLHAIIESQVDFQKEK